MSTDTALALGALALITPRTATRLRVFLLSFAIVDERHIADVGEFLEGKLDAIRAHISQVLKNRLVDLEAVEAQARYRGFQARLNHGHAEGFALARFVWDLEVPTIERDALDRVLMEVRNDS